MARGRYEESSIRVLKGLQPVRERPGKLARAVRAPAIGDDDLGRAAQGAKALEHGGDDAGLVQRWNDDGEPGLHARIISRR